MSFQFNAKDIAAIQVTADATPSATTTARNVATAELASRLISRCQDAPTEAHVRMALFKALIASTEDEVERNLLLEMSALSNHMDNDERSNQLADVSDAFTEFMDTEIQACEHLAA